VFPVTLVGEHWTGERLILMQDKGGLKCRARNCARYLIKVLQPSHHYHINITWLTHNLLEKKDFTCFSNEIDH
jgi:hypothetical protein